MHSRDGARDALFLMIFGLCLVQFVQFVEYGRRNPQKVVAKVKAKMAKMAKEREKMAKEKAKAAKAVKIEGKKALNGLRVLARTWEMGEATRSAIFLSLLLICSRFSCRST